MFKNTFTYIGLLLFVTFLSSTSLIFSQLNEKINYQEEPSPLMKLKGDTLRNKTGVEVPIMPGSYMQKFSDMQDSAYISALGLKVPADSRFQNDLRQFLPNNSSQRELIQEKTLADIISENLNLPSKFFMPSAVQMTMHDYNIMQSQYIPFVKTQQIGGLKVSLSSIAMFLGLIEDTSPNITYNLDQTSEIEVVIYSVQAVVIATLYKGTQLPGSYKLVWNFRDDKGRLQPSGDYIAEVRIGKDRYTRKRIYIP